MTPSVFAWRHVRRPKGRFIVAAGQIVRAVNYLLVVLSCYRKLLFEILDRSDDDDDE